MHKATLYEKLDNDMVQCITCNHYCEIPNKKSGICGVRKNVNGELYLLVYGRPVAVHVDPIEKKPLFHFMPNTPVFSIGTYGCNFRCMFCQNWNIAMVKDTSNIEKLIENCPEWMPEDIVSHCKENNIPIISYTYTEPTIFAEYAYDTMKLANENGIKNVFVSNGFETEQTLDLLEPYLDGINVDLKSFTDEFYRKVCGGRLQPVLDTIKSLYKRKIWLEVTTLVIPDSNDSDEVLNGIADFISSIDKNIPWHISCFSPAYKMSDKDETPMSTLERAYQIGKEHGLNYVYVGNVISETRENTYCDKCHFQLISRKGYFVTVAEEFEKGKCKKCGEKIPGVWVSTQRKEEK